jgi:hypothetical protein
MCVTDRQAGRVRPLCRSAREECRTLLPDAPARTSFLNPDCLLPIALHPRAVPYTLEVPFTPCLVPRALYARRAFPRALYARRAFHPVPCTLDVPFPRALYAGVPCTRALYGRRAFHLPRFEACRPFGTLCASVMALQNRLKGDPEAGHLARRG